MIRRPSTDHLTRQFELFHRNNPHILNKVLEAADALWAVGVRKGSMKMIFEHLRWDHLLRHGRTLELNNNFHAYYARIVIQLRPKMWRFFELRKQHIDYVPDLVALGIRPAPVAIKNGEQHG